ncbi:conserved hypothetical protein [Neisseria gonorrhoeae DGI2]|uniref:BirA-related protein n=1 Tax=Neisseria gonorrhoeae (strain NCCP11945) TaxID=521006 RepID=B4RQT9_NEIG2|nr:BirA-related protein [Neisseria gonorrhoeae NCCP11945]EEZ53730.1 predicted protein [Neisseria gonorrhoeae PID332]EEZ57958.1 predicted protein [Neisseria gonorrhoeae SK-92-679]EFE03830.1 conserved hypothetical protein [Neisseria gonorrhoeae DGI2]KDM98870.1 biotin transporter BioY [Neisseria gonorrhoeae]
MRTAAVFFCMKISVFNRYFHSLSNDALPFFAGGCFYICFNSMDCILEDVFRYGAGKSFSVNGLSDRAVFT